MNRHNYQKHIAYSGILLVATLVLFDVTPTDLWVQHHFFSVAFHKWYWDGSEPLKRFFLYDGLKAFLIAFASALTLCLLFLKDRPLIHSYSRGIRIVLISLILVPASVSELKATTNVACPRALTEFGGTLPYVPLFEHYPPQHQPHNRQRCFPAGHASGGFALMSLFFLLKSRRNQTLALSLATILGWAMGNYKMLIGDHFVSHTIISMLLAWILINLIAFIDALLSSQSTPRSLMG